MGGVARVNQSLSVGLSVLLMFTIDRGLRAVRHIRVREPHRPPLRPPSIPARVCRQQPTSCKPWWRRSLFTRMHWWRRS